METGGSLTAPKSVRKLQTALHAKAKESPDFRFYALSDKVWRADILQAAWHAVRRNGGAAGVDGETVERIKEQGLERWLGELARDLKEGTCWTECGAAGADTQEASREVPTVGHTVRTGSSRTDGSTDGADADL